MRLLASLILSSLALLAGCAAAETGEDAQGYSGSAILVGPRITPGIYARGVGDTATTLVIQSVTTDEVRFSYRLNGKRIDAGATPTSEQWISDGHDCRIELEPHSDEITVKRSGKCGFETSLVNHTDYRKVTPPKPGEYAGTDGNHSLAIGSLDDVSLPVSITLDGRAIPSAKAMPTVLGWSFVSGTCAVDVRVGSDDTRIHVLHSGCTDSGEQGTAAFMKANGT